MNNKKLATSALGLAGLEVCRLENEKYKRFESTDVEVSEKVDLKIKKLIATHNRKVQLKDTLIKTACIAFAFLIISSAVLAVNVEARDRLRKLIRQVFNTNVDYIPIKNEIEKTSEYVIKNVVVGWIPEGFKCIDIFRNEREVSYYYKGDNAAIFIECFLNDGNRSWGYTSTGESNIENEVGIYQGCYYEFIYANEASRTNNLLVIDENENYCVAIDSSLGKDILFRIYDSLSIIVDLNSDI